MNGKIKTTVLVALLGVVFTAELQAQLPNAWQITDATNATGSVLSYSTNLPVPLQVVATNAGFDFGVNARFVTDYGLSNQTMAMLYNDGTTRWEILWSLTNGDLVSDLMTNSGATNLPQRFYRVISP